MTVEIKIGQVEYCNAVGKCQASPQGYVSYMGNSWRKPTSAQVAQHALQQLDAARQKDVAAHERNVPIIESNRKIHEHVVAMMDEIGMPKGWSEPDRKSRSRFPKQIRHDAGYLVDLRREAKLDDGFASASMTYESLKKRYDEYATQAEREAEIERTKAARGQETAKAERRANIEMAAATDTRRLASKPITASVMVDNSGGQQAYCLMAAWRSKDDALAALEVVGGALTGTPDAAVPAAQPAQRLTRQQIFDRFGFLEGLVSHNTYRRIAEVAIDIHGAATQAAAVVPVNMSSEVQRMAQMAHTAMNQTPADMRNIMEDLADGLTRLLATSAAPAAALELLVAGGFVTQAKADEATQIALHTPGAAAASGWSGWACQYPNKMPRLYGALKIAELNCDSANGDRLLHLVEVPQAGQLSGSGEVDAGYADLYRWLRMNLAYADFNGGWYFDHDGWPGRQRGDDVDAAIRAAIAAMGKGAAS